MPGIWEIEKNQMPGIWENSGKTGGHRVTLPMCQPVFQRSFDYLIILPQMLFPSQTSYFSIVHS